MQQDTIKYGLLYAILSILASLATYYIAPKELFTFFSLKTIVGFAFMFGCMYLAAKKARDRTGGFISFGEALVPAFLVYLIGGIIGVLFVHLLMNYYDPSLLEMAKEYQRGIQESGDKMLGLSEAQILENLEKLEQKQAEESTITLMHSILGFLGVCVFLGLPSAAIIAVIVKKKAPDLV